MCTESSGDRLRTVLSNRHDVLRALCTEVTTKPELVETLDAARSTIDRAIRDLEAVGCIESSNGGYRSTATGQLALAEHDGYVSKTDAIDHATAFVNELPAASPMDCAMLRECEITLSEPHAPEMALQSSIDVFNHATTMRGLAPVVLTLYPKLIEDRVSAGDLTVEIIAQQNVVDSLAALDDNTGAPLTETDAVSLYSTTDSLPYALWIMDTPEQDVAGITAYADGSVHGVLTNDSDAALRWARDQYQTYKSHATRAESL